ARGGAEIQGENGAARRCREDRGRLRRALGEGWRALAHGGGSFSSDVGEWTGNTATARAKPLGVGVGEPARRGSPPPPEGVAFTPTTSRSHQNLEFIW